METKIVITAENLETLNVHAKVYPFLDKALRRGLTVRQVTSLRTDGTSNYVISSDDNPIDDFELWIFFAAGKNGGKCDLYRYSPHGKGRKDKKVTRQMAGIVIEDMGDALDRHQARQAAKTVQVHQVTVSATDAPATAAESALRQEQAADLTAATVVSDSPGSEVFAHAVALVSQLNRNGRVVLRLVRDRGPAAGRLPAATPRKVRGALIKRGVADATGALTELGRAARQLVISA